MGERSQIQRAGSYREQQQSDQEGRPTDPAERQRDQRSTGPARAPPVETSQQVEPNGQQLPGQEEVNASAAVMITATAPSVSA
jgi:hypothetical protein